MHDKVTRRALLGHTALAGAGLTLGGRALAAAPRAAAAGVVALPSPAQVREDITRMVRFGPRLTGSPAHARYVAWLERELVQAGAALRPCDEYAYERWSVGRFGLDVLDGTAAGPVPVAAYYPRSTETPEAGIEGPLVYGGVLPVPSVNGLDAQALVAGLARYPQDVATWASALPGRLGAIDGSVLVVDLPMPLPITAGVFTAIAQHLHWPGHTIADWAGIDYKRSWIMPGLGVPLAPFAALGARGVVFIVDASRQALTGDYLPFDHGHEPLPALYVDRDTGRALRTATGRRPSARLTLTATRQKVAVPSVTAVLPGETDECVILNTHTDGQGFVEENGGVAFVHLARHFGSLPKERRLRRTLVFAAWPGHMSGALPELEGWMAAHRDLVGKAAAALTIEHLGCSEWIDDAAAGYHATGQNEVFGVWVTQGRFFEEVRDATIAQGDAMARTALLRPPVQFGVGGAFQSAGVPQIGAIAGPEYLLTVRDDGDLDKLDERLAAAQTAWLADILRRVDRIPAEELRAGDPTLGSEVPDHDPSTRAGCGPPPGWVVDVDDDRALSLRFLGRRHGGVRLRAVASGDAVDGVAAELRRGGTVVARSRAVRVGTGGARDVLLRVRPGERLRAGAHTLVVRRGRTVLGRRAVRLGR